MHTKGEWKAVNIPSIGFEILTTLDEDKPMYKRMRICHMPWSDGLNPKVEEIIEANAHLIAASPKMHLCLTDLINIFTYHLYKHEAKLQELLGDDWDKFIKAYSYGCEAIAKAEGG